MVQQIQLGAGSGSGSASPPCRKKKIPRRPEAKPKIIWGKYRSTEEEKKPEKVLINNLAAKSTKCGEKMRLDEGQSNSKLAWMNILVYWSVGYYLGGTKGGYGYLSRFTWKHLSLWHIVALLTTLECQRRFVTRFHNYGRKVEYFWCVLFALGNGVFETFCFLASYDLGRRTLADAFGWSDLTAIAVGWLIYNIYAAVIHVALWLPYVFPKHTKQDAPPFHTHGLPLVTLFSLTWFIVYENYQDIAFICFLHFLLDTWVGLCLAIPGPFANTVIGDKRIN